MLALVNFFSVVVTVMRYQKHLIAGYVIIAVMALLLAEKAVLRYGIRGAAVLYTILMAMLAAIFACITFWFIHKKRQHLAEDAA